MADYDGDIKLHVDLDTKSVLQSLKDITQAAKSAFSGNASSGLDKNVQATNRSLQQTQRELKKVQSEIEKTAHKRDEYEARYEAVGARGTRTPTKKNQYEYMGEYYTKSDAERLAVLVQQIENSDEKLNRLRSELESIHISADAAETMEQTATSAADAERNTSGLRAVLNRIGGVASKMGRTVLNAFKKIGVSAVKTIKDITAKFSNALITPFQSIGNKIMGIFKKVGVSIRRVFIFSVLTSAFRDIRSSIGELINSNEQLNNSLRQIKYNMWTAFAPIYNNVLPALNALMDALSKATGYVAAFFSALTGNTVSQSYSQAQSLRNSINTEDRIDAEIKAINKKIQAIEKEKRAYEKRKKAEEEANKRSLLSFDELNQIGAPETEDATLKAYENQIEALEEQIELLQEQKEAIEDSAKAAEDLLYPTQAEAAYGQALKLVDILKNAWKDADFTELGNIIQDKISSALNSIKWDNVKRNAEKAGKSFATALNGLFGGDFGKSLGKTLGEAINTAVSGISGFVSNIDAAQLGKSISDFIVNAINIIDWGKIKSAARTAGQKIADFFNEAINPNSFGALGRAIGEAINTAINFANGFIDTIDPINIGKSIAAFLNNSVKTINWKELGRTIFTAIDKALKALITFLRDTDWEAVGQAIADFFKDIPWGELLKDVGTLIWEAIKAAIKTAAGFYKNADDGTKIIFQEALVAAEIAGLLKLIATIAKVVISVKGLLSIFGNKDKALQKQTKLTQEETQAVGEMASETATATQAANAFSPALQGVTSIGMSLIPVLQQMLQGNQQLTPAMQENIAVAGGAQGAYQNMAQGAANASAAYSGMATSAQTVSQAISASTSSINGYETATNNATSASTGFVSSISTAFQNVGQIIVSGIDSAISIISSLGSAFGNMVTMMTGHVANMGSSIQSGFSIAVNGIKSFTLNLSDVKETIAETASGAISKVSSMGTNISSSVGEMGENIMSTSKEYISDFSTMASGTEKYAGIIVAALAGIVTAIANVMSGMSGMAASFAGLTLPSGYGSNLGGDLGVFNISSIRAPALAQGAVIPPNREFLAVLGDQRSGTNIEAPLDTIKQAVAEVLGQGGFGGSDNVTVNFNGNLSQLARVLKPEISRERVRAGSSFIIGGNKVR